MPLLALCFLMVYLPYPGSSNAMRLAGSNACGTRRTCPFLPFPGYDGRVSSASTTKHIRLSIPSHDEGADGVVRSITGGANGYRMEREWDPEPCGCGWHVLCNPERIGMLRDKQR